MKTLLLAGLIAFAGIGVRSARAQETLEGIKIVAQGIVLDVQDADLRTVMAALAEAAGLNVVHNELPAKTVTLRLHDPVPRNRIKALLQSLVESAGLRFHDDGALIRVSVLESQPMVAEPQSSGSQVELFVYRLKHAPASRLAATLQSLFGLAYPAEPGSVPAGPSSLSEELRRQQVPPGIPASPDKDMPGTVVLGARVQGDVQIVPDELTNSLLIRASAADWTVISGAIEALDLRPLQVVIEVLIAEVRRSSLFDLGISASTEPKREPRTGAEISGELVGSTAGDFVLRILNLGRVEANILISSIYSRSDVTILSRPVILAQNNQDARIMIGSERPFVQVFRALPTDAAVRDQIVQYRDVGTSLKIRPTINYDGYVTLDLVQEVSTATSEVQFGAPVISTREASTRLLVRNGQTAVIGGLIDHQRDRTRGGIPVLRDIPLLGSLFGSTHDSKIQTELFLFITPHVAATDHDMDRLREQIGNNSQLLKKQLPRNPTIIQPDTTSQPR